MDNSGSVLYNAVPQSLLRYARSWLLCHVPLSRGASKVFGVGNMYISMSEKPAFYDINKHGGPGIIMASCKEREDSSIKPSLNPHV